MKKSHLRTIVAAGIAAVCITGNAAIPGNTRAISPKNASPQAEAMKAPGGDSGNPAKIPGTQIRRISQEDLADRNLTLLLEEDFSKFTEGSEASPVGPFPAGYLTEEYMQTPNWYGDGVYQAGGVCALAIPSVGGFLDSPEGNYSGKIIITFKAKAAEGNGTNPTFMFVSLLKDGIDYPNYTDEYSSYNDVRVTASEGWKDFAFECTNPYFVDDAFVQLNAVTYSTAGILLDDIKIYRDEDYIYCPITLSADTFTKDGFTARWNEVLNADGYLLSLYEETADDGEPTSVYADFDGISTETGILKDSDIPEGWEIHLTSDDQVTADGGADGSPAIILSDDEDYIQLPVTGGTFKSLSFFVKRINDVTTGYFAIDVLKPSTGKWVNIGYISSGAVTTGVTITDTEHLAGFSDTYTGVRLRPENSDGTQIAVDNISYEISGTTSSRCVAEDINTSELQYTFSDLNPDAEHYFTVTAYKGDEKSEPSIRTHAFGIADPVALDPTDVDSRGGFTANWEQTPRATRYDVFAYEINEFAEDTPGYVILSEDFSNVKSTGTAEDPEILNNTSNYTSLDDYTSVPGWTGCGNILADGMLGCDEDPYGMYEIFTPVISLQNNDGNYKVYIKIWSTEGAVVVVQGNGVYRLLEFADTGLCEATIDLDNGKMSDQLMLYAQYGEAFLIDEIKVFQDIKAGDRLYSEIEHAEAGDATSHYFTIYPEEGRKYGYCVVAHQEIFGSTYTTEPSNVTEVDFFNTGIENIAAAERLGAEIFTEGNVLKVILAGESAISVYNLQGRLVAAADGVAGENCLTLPAGMYVVTAGGKAQKIIIGNN